MERKMIAGAACMLVMLGALLQPVEIRAQAMADYTGTPPFISNVVPPNILLILDNSGSMNEAAYQTAFDTAKAYFGLFDPYECYTYSTNSFQPDSSDNPTTVGTCGTSYPWSGSLLNYATMRRVDIVKWVMMGGTCSVGGRSTNGVCRQLIGQSTFDSGACCANQTVSVTVAQATGRMPSANIPSSGNVYFHNMGSISSLKGSICVDNDSTQPGGTSCSDSDSFAESNWQIQVNLLQDASGVIQQVGSKARFGLMEFKGAGDGGKVLNNIGGNTTDMITGIESTTPSTWTPLAESLYESTRYFAQLAPAYTNSDYSYNVTTKDPFYFQSPTWADSSQYVTCCKSFVIIFTDGEPTQDTNIPSALQDYAHAVHGTHCTGVTTATTCTPHKTNYANNGSHYLDDVAYWAHTTDLRQATIPVINESGKDLSGNQNLIIYTFYAFGEDIGREILQTTAKAGGFEDRNGNNLPDLTEEWDRVNNNTGAAGADGIPDTYFESANADELQDRLLAAITSILQRSASGTSVSVLASSSTGDGSLYQAYFFPSTFEGLNEIKWTGYTQGLFIDEFGNLREDTDGDATLVYSKDYIIQTRYDTASGDVKLDRFKDLDGDGKADTTTAFETVTLRETMAIWEAGKQLALKNAADRKILTWVDGDNDGFVDAGEQIAFITANATTLSPYLRASSTAPYTATNIIDFIRGTQVSGMRDRQMQVPAGSGTLKVWKLGDPIHSTPTIVGAPKERYDVIYGDTSYTAFFQKYKSRRQVAYVGSNDGMLHAFNAGFYHRGDNSATSSVTEHGYFTKNATDNSSGAALGDELWGFVPYQLLPHLKWLTQTDYTHVYYVDLKPKITDARIFADDATHPGGWGTILIGGFRMGGSCGACVASTGGPSMQVTADFTGSGTSTTRTFYTAYFVLDITDPEQDPVLLWSFSQSDLGLSTNYPTILRVKPACSGDNCKIDNTNAKWLMLVGSGVTGYAGSSAQTSKFFAVDLKTGPVDASSGVSLVTTFTTSDSNSFFGDLISLDAQLDYRADVAYAGNVITSTNPKWIGKLYRLTTNGGNVDPSTWGILNGSNRAPTVLLSTFPSDNSLKVGPITAAPTVAADDVNNIWVYFGSGRFYAVADKTNTDTQYFFGVKDPVVTGGCTESSVTSCVKNNLLNVSNITVCSTCATGTTQVTGLSGVTTFDGLQAKIEGTSSAPGMDGWYSTLPTLGERDVSTPIIIGGTVFFPTFTPTSDVCSSSGNGSLYALFYKTGSAYKSSIIGTETVGSNVNVKRSMSLGTGLSSQMAVHIGAQGSGDAGSSGGGGSSGRVSLIGQSSSGAVTKISASPALSSWSRMISWINQRD
ncbi:MAG: hypothetical protein EPO61_09145 [Nitrospirae bacterium]|nr:MAG: hypothetical protein EPO61_09145 [Nitrospirota bacterium]